MHGENIKRAAVFAHYDKDNIIDDYVIYYLKNLKKLCEKLIFVSDGTLSEQELQKLDNIADFSIAEPHKEYDFGSYKRGFFYLKTNNLLHNIDSLIFANDSCYAPLLPLENVFDVMEKEPCDFWGITKNKYGLRKRKNKYFTCKLEHIQSYFLVINSNVFNSECFSGFMNNIKYEEFKNDIIINYEIGLSEFLTSNGFKSSIYIKDYLNTSNPSLLKWKQLTKKSPFIKCSLLRHMNDKLTVVDDWEEVLRKNTNYPVELIKKNLERTINTNAKNRNLPVWLKVFILWINTYILPHKIRHIRSEVIEKYFKLKI